MHSLRVRNRAHLADDGHCDLTRILHLVLTLVRDSDGQLFGSGVGDEVVVDQHADLATGLDGVDSLDAVERGGHRFELFQAFDVGLEKLAPEMALAACTMRENWKSFKLLSPYLKRVGGPLFLRQQVSAHGFLIPAGINLFLDAEDALDGFVLNLPRIAMIRAHLNSNLIIK